MPNYKYLIIDPVKALPIYNLELIFDFQRPKDLSFLYQSRAYFSFKSFYVK